MLTSIIEHGNQAVKGELGIIPLKSQYSLYNPQDWIGFCINRNGNPTGLGGDVHDTYKVNKDGISGGHTTVNIPGFDKKRITHK